MKYKQNLIEGPFSFSSFPEINENLKNQDDLITYCLSSWQNLKSNIKSYTFNLFEEYNCNLKNRKTENAFVQGPFYERILAIHNLIAEGNNSGYILTFKKASILAPQAKIEFFYDAECTKKIVEVIALKNQRNNIIDFIELKNIIK